jgi:hypothetical protein
MQPTLTPEQHEHVVSVVLLWDLGAPTDWGDVVRYEIDHLFEMSMSCAYPTRAARIIAAAGHHEPVVRPSARELVVEAVDQGVSPQVLARRMGRDVGPELAHDLMVEERARRAGEPSPTVVARFFADSRG